ncbi:hypothetical protein [Nocardia sp. SSK8]|uniref:hypothetical protein n=1 Tax=Nocardia sp. SSK8 TaxID=3120154 RepID=UPI00300ACD1D
MPSAATPGKRVLAYVITGALSLCLASVTLFSAIQPINVLAYWLGYGESSQVLVTKGSSSSSSIGRSEAGEGRIIADDRVVRLYGASVGDTVTARPRLIALGAKQYVYHSPLRAAEDLVWLIPTALFGFPLAMMLFAVISPTRAQNFSQRLKARNER